MNTFQVDGKTGQPMVCYSCGGPASMQKRDQFTLAMHPICFACSGMRDYEAELTVAKERIAELEQQLATVRAETFDRCAMIAEEVDPRNSDYAGAEVAAAIRTAAKEASQ